jgi:hypothetical protein
MLSDSLSDAHNDLCRELYEYTSGKFKNAYPIEVILEVQVVIDLIDEVGSRISQLPEKDM